MVKTDIELCNVINLYIILVILNELNHCTSGTIRTKLKRHNLNLTVSTLFSHLDRLEKQGYLKISITSRNHIAQKKYYTVLPKGIELTKDHLIKLLSLSHTLNEYQQDGIRLAS